MPTPTPTPTGDSPDGEWTPFTTGGSPVAAEYRKEGRTVRWRFAGTDAEMVVPSWPIEPLGETTGNIRSTPDGRLIETRDRAEHPDLTDTYRRRIATLTVENHRLASLLDGVLADDPQAIRDAAAWLTVNRPEVEG